MIKLFTKACLSKIMVASLFALFIMGTHSCSVIEIAEPVYVKEVQPVQFDFEEIHNRGTLRMITRYNPISYFLLDGRDRGFEYELVSRFARENGLKVEVVLIGPNEDPLQLLESGEGDLIADHFVIDVELLEHVTYSTPYNFINQVYEISNARNDDSSFFPFPDEEMVGSSIQKYQTAARYIGEKSSGLTVIKSDSIAWVTRKNAPVLKQKMDEFIGKHIKVRESDGRILRSSYLNLVHRRYFEEDEYISRYHDRAYDAIYTGILSPYDEMVKSISEEAGVDWRLVIAVMAQESAFDPKAVSIAGALGLMQIIPRFSRVVDKTELYDPEINIREGVRYIKKHLTREAHLDSLNRHSMALAAYNVGMGNLADARELAVRLGKDPDEWPNIANALLKLMDPEYFQHARYGYKNGNETVNYVEDVLIRYSRYLAIDRMAANLKEGDYHDMLVQTW
ncbi:MAG: transglycosylase SLT domain-containing protein [Balneolaceae bacterium]